MNGPTIIVSVCQSGVVTHGPWELPPKDPGMLAQRLLQGTEAFLS